MRKTAFCIWENKDADQLRSFCAADQHLCFHTKIVQSLYFLNPKFQTSYQYLWLKFVSDLVGNPEDRFCHDAAYIRRAFNSTGRKLV